MLKVFVNFILFITTFIVGAGSLLKNNYLMGLCLIILSILLYIKMYNKNSKRNIRRL